MISESDIKRIVKKVKSDNINEGLFDTFLVVDILDTQMTYQKLWKILSLTYIMIKI